MKRQNIKLKIFLFAFVFTAILVSIFGKLAVAVEKGDAPKTIVFNQDLEAFEKRLNRAITLDVRDMNIVDVIKFLALKGDFNVIINPSVQGKVTVLLNSVTIKDALDIVVISNNLAYFIERDIIHVMSEGEFLSIYGRNFRDKSNVAIIRLRYSKPSYVLAALDNVKSNIGKIIIDEDTGSIVLIDTIEAIEAMRAVVQDIDQPLETFVYSLQYAEAAEIAETLRARIDANSVGSVTPDERSNQLIVRVFPKRRDEVESIIATLDVPPKEVLIEARILQIVLKPKYDMGIDWQSDFKNSGHDNLRDLSFQSIMLNRDGMSGSDNLYQTFGEVAFGDFGVDQLEGAIRALRQVSDTKILANPRLLVTNNEEAKIHIGDTVPYIISTTSGTGDNAITSEDVRFVDVGIKLDVQPVINDDGFILMNIKPEISTVVGTVDSQGGGIPQVNKTLVETSILVQDGMTIILGGLKKEDKSHTRKGIPLLMDLPLLGKAFTRSSDAITSTEIVIFITPHIVTGEEDYLELKGSIKPSKSYTGI